MLEDRLGGAAVVAEMHRQQGRPVSPYIGLQGRFTARSTLTGHHHVRGVQLLQQERRDLALEPPGVDHGDHRHDAHRQGAPTQGVHNVRRPGQAGGLDEDAVRGDLVQDGLNPWNEGIRRGAAHAAAGDFGHGDLGPQELGVDARLAEVVHHHRAPLRALAELIEEQGRLAGAEEAGHHMYWGHAQ